MPGIGNHAGGSSTACSRRMCLFVSPFLSGFFPLLAAAFSTPPIASIGRSSSHQQQSFSLAYTNLPGEHGDGNITIDESVLQQMRSELDVASPNADLLTTSEAMKYYHLNQQDDDGVKIKSLIHELNETMKEDLPKAIQPSKEKPSKPYKSPIQVYQLVPRVQPIQKASVFFLSVKPTKAKDADIKPKLDWKTANKGHKATTFQATNYLNMLGETKSNKPEDGDALNEDLKQQQAELRNEKRKLQAQAFYDANRRTNPNEAIKNRIEKSNKERAEKERSALERSYAERKERIDEQLYMDELKQQEQGADRDPQKAKGDDVINLSTKEKLLSLSSGRRGISIFERPSFVETTPLLVSQTLVFDYDELTPFQQRSIEIARWYNEEHLERMKLEASAGEEGGIEASPFTAVIDTISAKMTTSKKHADRSPPRRYATLAAIEFIGGGKVQLTGVGRVLLHSYFSSSDAGLSRDEQELNALLTRIQEIDRKASLDSEDDRVSEGKEEERDESDREPSVIMAEFEVLLDNSSIVAEMTSKYSDVSQNRSSTMHAITRLYRSANRVYRLHEERKKLVAGLRAGEARLKLGRARKEGECILFDDFEYDGLGLHNNFSVDELAECVQYSELETTDNFGFSYGFLSTFPDLTSEVMSLLEPFYSPHHREREEFVAEVSSFVALRTLEDYASPTELATALLTLTAKERLDMSYEIMLRHKDELSALTRTMSKDLIDCGEECKDLW
mmetsp:Transcript_3827/g.8597  ORF Transcript_3827/g.8597 Transcript_3827/m.8597 type:complete len:734 (+) Transcript_3827:187-2388(+)